MARTKGSDKKPPYHKWTAEEKQLAFNWHKKGYPPARIADEKLPHLRPGQISSMINNSRLKKLVKTGTISNPIATSALEEELDEDVDDDVVLEEDDASGTSPVDLFSNFIKNNIVYTYESNSHLFVFIRLFEDMELKVGPIQQFGLTIQMKFPPIPKKILNLIGLPAQDLNIVNRQFEEDRNELEFLVPSSKELCRSQDKYDKKIVQLDTSREGSPVLVKWAIIKIEFYTKFGQ